MNHVQSLRYDKFGTWLTRDGTVFKGAAVPGDPGTGRATARVQKICSVCKGTGRNQQIGGSCLECTGTRIKIELIDLYSPQQLEYENRIGRLKLQKRMNGAPVDQDSKTDEEQRNERRAAVHQWLHQAAPYVLDLLNSLPSPSGNAWALLNACYKAGRLTKQDVEALKRIVDTHIAYHQRLATARHIGTVGQTCFWPEVDVFMSWANKDRSWFVALCWDAPHRAALLWQGSLNIGRQGDRLLGLRATVSEHLVHQGSCQTKIIEPRWDMRLQHSVNPKSPDLIDSETPQP